MTRPAAPWRPGSHQRSAVPVEGSSPKDLSVRPVEVIQNPVGLLGPHGHAARVGPERPLTTLPLLPNKSVWKVDIGQMVLAGDGVLKGVAAAFADALGFEHALGAAPLDRNSGLHQPADFKSRPENLPGHAPQFPGEDLTESFDLLVGRGRLDDEDALAVALMNGLGPGDNCRTLHRREIDVAARAVVDDHSHQGAAAAVLRVGEAAEVAAAAEVTVAKLVAPAFERPARGC